MMPDYTSVQAVESITAMETPEKRNFRITQSYHELSLALAERLGPGANWCCFATWASRQAGQTIRGEDLEKTLERWVASPDGARLVTDLIRESAGEAGRQPVLSLLMKVLEPAAALQRASAAVAKGNHKVYAEIAHAFARFLVGPFNNTAFDETGIHTWCNTLQPGNPPEGQEYLRRSFRHYYQALFEPVEKARAELLLLANLEVGFHEQTRLQPEIAGALDAGLEAPEVYARRLVDVLFPSKAGWMRLGWQLMRFFGRKSRLEAAIQTFADALRRQLRFFLTEHLMTLSMPDRTLYLGSDLRGDFPDMLRQLDHPELHALLAKVDPSPDSLRDTGAVDWADFSERMHYIADLFRKTHLDKVLWEPPFSARQTEEIKKD